MSVRATVSINQANLLAEGLRSRGYAPEPIFESVGLPVSTENDPTKRVPLADIVTLGKACEKYLGDPGIVHKLYSGIRLAYLDSLGISLLYSQTLLEFIGRFQKYSSYAVTRAAIDLFEVDDGYYAGCEWNLGVSDADQQRVAEWFTCAFISMCNEVLGEDLEIDQAFLDFVPSETMMSVIERHAKSVEYDHNRYGFLFSRELLNRKLPLGNPQMALAAEELTLRNLEAIETVSVSLRVERRILESLERGDFSKEAIARSLGISLSTLHERLSEEGTSYSEVLESVRQERALRYMRSGMLRVSQVGYALGFRNPSSFSRAFKSWTGMTPGEFRRHLGD